MAKLYATDHAQSIIDKAVQLLGGRGLVHGHPVERLYREVRALRIYEGASEVLKLIIATRVLETIAAQAAPGAARAGSGPAARSSRVPGKKKS